MNSKTVCVAILDLYNNQENQAIRCIKDILNDVNRGYRNISISYKLFDVRYKNERPDVNYDIYISSGGPGSPWDGEGTKWEANYFSLIDSLWSHNRNCKSKKHVFFICHSFQIMARFFKLGEVIPRHSKSIGVVPIYKTEFGEKDIVLKGLPQPFFAVDSREWQVVQPNQKTFDELSAKILCLEDFSPNGELEPAMMAIRCSNEFVGTQFHPEADTLSMSIKLKKQENIKDIISRFGEKKYYELLDLIEQPKGIILTKQTIIPNFLKKAIQDLRPELV